MDFLFDDACSSLERNLGKLTLYKADRLLHKMYTSLYKCRPGKINSTFPKSNALHVQL